MAALAARLSSLGLADGARIGLLLPNASEHALTLIAVMRAGLTPVLLPLAADSAALAVLARGAVIEAIVTQASFASEDIVGRACATAASTLSTRFVLAFGPNVPDEVLDIEAGRVADSPNRQSPPSSTLIVGTAAPQPAIDTLDAARLDAFVGRMREALDPTTVAAVASFVSPTSVAGLTTTLGLALATGRPLEFHALPSARDIRAALSRLPPVLAVLPAALMPVLASSEGVSTATICFVDPRPPVGGASRRLDVERLASGALTVRSLT